MATPPATPPAIAATGVDEVDDEVLPVTLGVDDEALPVTLGAESC